MTKQRQVILDIVNRSYSHPTAEDIYKEAKLLLPSLALGTVYRNLGIMVNQGEIRRIVSENNPDRYDRTAPFHDHMVCTVCGDITDTVIGDFNSKIEKCVGEKIVGYELIVKHVCSKCKNL